MMVPEWRKKRNESNRQYVFQWLLDHPCVDCGQKDIRVLQFDHVKEKKSGVLDMANRYSLEALKQEIEKCDVVCCNCHHIRTLTRAGSKRIEFYEQQQNN